MDVKPIGIDALKRYTDVDEDAVNEILDTVLSSLDKKIVVLDDDPTGVQTVHNVSVYTEWDEYSISQGFDENKSIFFILTNSRGLTAEEAEKVNENIAKTVTKVAEEKGKDFILISRSDSTMRGHYPLETEILKKVCESETGKRFHGEVIMPFFVEGGRYTVDDIHYVKEDEVLVPAGMTEFAKDKTFGYVSSHIGEWFEEKTCGRYRKEDATYISLEELRNMDIEGISDRLMKVDDFNKVVVNAIDYIDVKIFTIALLKAMEQGKRFIFRSAAALPKVLGGVTDKKLLQRDELVPQNNEHGGIILVGSYVNKTTRQLEELKKSDYPIEFIEFDTHLVQKEDGLEKEVERVVGIVEGKIKRGQTVAVYTRREFLTLENSTKDEQLKVQVRISDAVTSIVGSLKVKPNFIVAKGGITSSDVGTKALRVKKALVMGQIKPGIPVWMTGDESKFPNMSYVIFPGNVGTVDTLKEVVEKLMG